MCGILFHQGTTNSLEIWPRARRALLKIRHRGPDSEGLLGVTADGTVLTEGNPVRTILGFRRLAIVDLSSDGDQPMVCSETGNVILFNGEIYNFLELRTELEQLGCKFRTNSDTEVVLSAYRIWGSTAFGKFNGMWAIIIFDRSKNEFLFSRDRLGVKPLYYFHDGKNISFASEIRALLLMLDERPKLNLNVAFDYFTTIRTELNEETFFDGIFAVPAGALWRLDSGGRIKRSWYHKWSRDIDDSTAQSVQDARIIELLTDSVKLRLRSDAPSVCLLSGGLDSSIITSIASRTSVSTRRTNFQGAFTYGYSEEIYAADDEQTLARRLMSTLPHSMRHTVKEYSPVPDINELLALIVAQEQPFNTPSVLAGFRMSKAIRDDGFAIALSGEGADELFGGYTRLYLSLLARTSTHRCNLPLLVKLLRSSHINLSTIINRLTWDLPMIVLEQLHRKFRPNIALMTAEFWSSKRERFRASVDFNRMGVQDRIGSDIIRTNLPEILRFSDRSSMNASVEMRHPFLDYRVVQFALSLPWKQKVGPEGGKLILRRAFKDILPSWVTERGKVQGFGNAEQYQVSKLKLTSLFDRAPVTTWELIDKAGLEKAVRESNMHPSVWLPVCFVLWTVALNENLI